MSVQFDYEGSCQTINCGNQGVIFDAPSLDGVLQNIVCGVCGVDFTGNCQPK